MKKPVNQLIQRFKEKGNRNQWKPPTIEFPKISNEDPNNIFKVPVFDFVLPKGKVPCIESCKPIKQKTLARLVHDIDHVTIVHFEQYKCRAGQKRRDANKARKSTNGQDHQASDKEDSGDDDDDCDDGDGNNEEEEVEDEECIFGDEEEVEGDDGPITFNTLNPLFIKKLPKKVQSAFKYILSHKTGFSRKLVKEVLFENITTGGGVEGARNILQKRRAARYAELLKRFAHHQKEVNWNEKEQRVIMIHSANPISAPGYFKIHKLPDHASMRDVFLRFTDPLAKLSLLFRRSLEVRSSIILDGNFKYTKLMKIKVEGEFVQSDQWHLLMVAMNEIGQVIAYKLCKAESHEELEGLLCEIKKYNLRPPGTTTSTFNFGDSTCAPYNDDDDGGCDGDTADDDVNGGDSVDGAENLDSEVSREQTEQPENNQTNGVFTSNEIPVNPQLNEFLATITNNLNIEHVDESKDILVVCDHSPLLRNLVQKILGERCRTVQDIYHLVARPPECLHPNAKKQLSRPLSEAVFVTTPSGNRSSKKLKSKEVHPPEIMMANLVEVFKSIPKKSIKDQQGLEGTIRNTMDLIARNELRPTNNTNIYTENGLTRSKMSTSPLEAFFKFLKRILPLTFARIDIAIRIFDIHILRWGIMQGQQYGRIPNLYGMDLLDLLEAASELDDVCTPTPQTQFIWGLARVLVSDEDSTSDSAHATSTTVSLRNQSAITRLTSHLNIVTSSWEVARLSKQRSIMGYLEPNATTSRTRASPTLISKTLLGLNITYEDLADQTSFTTEEYKLLKSICYSLRYHQTKFKDCLFGESAMVTTWLFVYVVLSRSNVPNLKVRSYKAIQDMVTSKQEGWKQEWGVDPKAEPALAEDLYHTLRGYGSNLTSTIRNMEFSAAWDFAGCNLPHIFRRKGTGPSTSREAIYDNENLKYRRSLKVSAITSGSTSVQQQHAAVQSPIIQTTQTREIVSSSTHAVAPLPRSPQNTTAGATTSSKHSRSEDPNDAVLWSYQNQVQITEYVENMREATSKPNKAGRVDWKKVLEWAIANVSDGFSSYQTMEKGRDKFKNRCYNYHYRETAQPVRNLPSQEPSASTTQTIPSNSLQIVPRAPLAAQPPPSLTRAIPISATPLAIVDEIVMNTSPNSTRLSRLITTSSGPVSNRPVARRPAISQNRPQQVANSVGPKKRKRADATS
ncbi:hypothetical protein HDU76_004820, partial [Blyttiomyces sp. JEL0837]